LGRRKPFNLTFVEIGNEDNLYGGKDSYETYRFDAFYSAISQAYPALQILASYTLATAPANTCEDYHVYSRPDALVAKFNQWDNWNRSYPIVIGEYGVIQNNDASQPDVNWSAPQLAGQNMVSSTAEAVYLIGCERNSDVCHGTSWGALFKNWNFDPQSLALIKHTAVPSDTIFSYSYYVQQIFSKHRVSVSLSVAAKHADGSVASSGGPIYHTAGLDEANKKYVMKFANYNGTVTPITVQAPGNVGRHATLVKLSAESPFAYNSLGNETSILTTSAVKKGREGFGPFTLDRHEVAVLAIDV
jgi:alpha-N-arabinofuranosidase